MLGVFILPRARANGAGESSVLEVPLGAHRAEDDWEGRREPDGISSFSHLSLWFLLSELKQVTELWLA